MHRVLRLQTQEDEIEVESPISTPSMYACGGDTTVSRVDLAS